MSHCTDEAASHPESQKPLSCTWREWIARPEAEREVDAIVVGSGYGGSVAALRLAEKGHRVLLLERGSEYLPGDFPNDFSNVPKHFRLNIPGRGVPMGRASGLVEISVGQGMVAVTGNGLGGGSLINAGVVIEPDRDVFAQDAWPGPIRHAFGENENAIAGESDLELAFNKARAVLRGQGFSGSTQGRSLFKIQALERAARALGARVDAAMVTIDPSRCIGCGDCASGCNVSGAKLSLPQTYLKAAVGTCKVQIVTQAQVYRFKHHPPEPKHKDETEASNTPARLKRWSLSVFSTDAQHEVLSVREAGTARPKDVQQDPARTLLELSSDTLVICAGALGSTQLLQRSQAMAGEALAFSPALGTRLSGNGDSISFSTAEHHWVNAIGDGTHHRQPGNPPEALLPPFAVGPTITASIDLRDKLKPLDQRLLLQDGAIPGAVSRVVSELLATTYTVGQLANWTFRHPDPVSQMDSPSDPLAATATLAGHTQVLLAMGHDNSPGRMIWLPGMDASAPVYGDPESLRTYREQQKIFDRLRSVGHHLHSPLWKWMPDTIRGFMSGEQPPATVTTVHPLGGCPMGDDPYTSVVNHLGQVWVHDPADPARGLNQSPPRPYPNAPRVYEGLYVLDGAIVPTSLGCNPMLTIAALVERAADKAFERHLSDEDAPFSRTTSPARPRVSYACPPFGRDVLLRETLRSSADSMRGRWMRAAAGGTQQLVLQAEFAASDFAKALAEPRHRMAISKAELTWIHTETPCNSRPQVAFNERPTVEVKFNLRDQSGLEAPGAQPAEQAWFEFLPAHTLSSGPLPVVLGALQVLLWVTYLVVTQTLVLNQALDWPGWPWGAAALSLISLGGFLLLGLILPLPSTALTWLVLRGAFDLQQWGKQRQNEPENRRGALPLLKSYFKQMMHATERRVMRYHLPMRQTDDKHPFAREILFTARKVVMYRASADQWIHWIAAHMRHIGRRTPPDMGMPPLRPSLWEQVMDADVTIRPHRLTSRFSNPRALFRGTLKMGMDNLFTRGLAQLGERGDTTSGILLLAGYPLLLARFLIKTRLLDFRLPNHSNRPLLDQPERSDLNARRGAGDSDELRLRLPEGETVAPSLHWIKVSRGFSSSDHGTEPMEELRLRLWRYQRTDTDGSAVPPAFEKSVWMKRPVCRVKSILLLHAFGQSGLIYTYRAPGSRAGSNLAEAFYAAGYEVWILDSRMSTRSGHATDPSNVDMQARHDVPVAVNHILDKLKEELKGASTDPMQIATFAQCIGSASLWMALLDGSLSHAGQSHCDAPGEEAVLSKIWAAMFSQVHALVQATPVVQSKTWLPAFLQALTPRGVIPFAVRGPQSSLGLNLLDRLLASLPVPQAEREQSLNEDGPATCKRIRFIEAPLFKHDNLHPGTVHDMTRLFGDANVRLFAHARRFVELGRLVDENGVNCYVTDAHIRQHLAFPVQLLHGKDNELFDVKSAFDTHALLGTLQAPWQRRYSASPLIVEGHGHLDVLIGKHAPTQVFPDLVKFFNRAFNEPQVVHHDSSEERWLLRAPRSGPWVGGSQRVGNQTKVRVAFLVDDLHGGSDEDLYTRVLLRKLRRPDHYETLPAQAFSSGYFRVNAFPNNAHPQALQEKSRLAYRVVWIDLDIDHLEVDGNADGVFQAMTLHKVWRTNDHAIPTDHRNSALSTVEDADIDHFLMTDNASSEDSRLCGLAKGTPVQEKLSARMAFSLSALSRSSLCPDNAGVVTFMATCCRYPGLTVDQERIDRALKPHVQRTFSLLVGDQIYADATAGLLDPLSPVERYTERYETAFGSPGMRQLLANTPTYMTPDDHEWIDNHPNRGPLLQWSWGDWTEDAEFQTQEEQRRDWAGGALTAFERSLSWPLSYLNGPPKERIKWTHHRHGCVDLYVIDSRSWRTRGSPNTVAQEVLEQIDSALQQARTDCLNVIVTGSVVLPGLFGSADPANPGETDTWQYAPAQRAQLLSLLVKHCPGRFLLLSGDYHVSAAVELRQNNRTVGAAFVVPPLYAPLPYANTAPEHLCINEPLEVGGQPLSLSVPLNGEALRGSGLGDFCVEKRSGGGFTVTFARRLVVYETGDSSALPLVCTVTLP